MPPKDVPKDTKVAPKEGKPNPLIATVKIAIAVVGIFGSFGYFAILQEDLFKKPYGMDAKGKGGEKFKSTFFMMVAERGVNSLVALVFLLVGGGSGCKIPIKEIALSGGTQMFAMAASNEALKFVSYPTQVLCALEGVCVHTHTHPLYISKPRRYWARAARWSQSF